MTVPYDLERLAGLLRRSNAGRRLEYRGEVESTQDVAFTLAEQGACDGSVVLADSQTRGRGRHGKAWHSPAGAGIWFSMVLRPGAAPPPVPPLLVAATAVAVAEAVERETDLVPGVRWPNDLVVGDRKIAGILVETRDFDPAAPLFVLGVGLNVTQGADDFDPEIRAEATSIAMEKGRAPERTLLLAAVLDALDHWRGTLEAGGAAPVEEAFRARVAYLGRRVTLREGETVVEGVLESASPVTGIFLKLDDGSWHAVRPEHARDLRPV